MKTINNTPIYLFIIDTEQYAGNFERQLCAWCTGHYGECGVGAEESIKFLGGTYNHEIFDDIIIKLPHDDNHKRPVTIYPTPGWYNNGHGEHFRDNKHSHKGKTKKKWPAYLSIAIFMNQEPNKETIEIIKQRAAKWNTYTETHEYLKPITITGYRLLKIETTIAELKSLSE